MSHQPSDLDNLIFALLDNSITPEEHSCLQVTLKNSPDARKRYHQLIELQELLESEADQQASNVIPMEDVLRRQRRRCAKNAMIAAAAVILFSALILQFVHIETPTAVAANATFSEFSKFHFNHPETEEKNLSYTMMRKGSTLDLEQGSAQLDLTSGVEAYVTAPAKLTLTDDLNLKLEKGTVWFNVPPKAVGFAVATKKLNVVDLGTQFGIIAKGDTHEVHVFKGRVEAQCLYGEKEKLQLDSDTARGTDPMGKLAYTDLNQASFLTHLPKGITNLQWNFSDPVGDQIVTEGNAPFAPEVKTHFTQPQNPSTPISQFLPGTSQLTTTWHGVGADRPRTITGWIKCPPHQPLADSSITEWGITEADAMGSKWRVNLNPNIDGKTGKTGALRTEFGYGYVIGSTDLRDGKWHHFASVYDGSGYGDEGSIKLYIDGKQEITSDSRPNTIHTILDSNKSTPCQIGRNFNGFIDQITVYLGALPAREIARQAKMDH